MPRTVPVQQRSLNTLESLRKAAREVITEKGRDRFTTNDVAERAGTSIGTLYRYFPDRVAILDDLYPNREMVLVEPGGPEGPSATALGSAAYQALSILDDKAISNPRERVRGAREVLSRVLGRE